MPKRKVQEQLRAINPVLVNPEEFRASLKVNPLSCFNPSVVALTGMAIVTAEVGMYPCGSHYRGKFFGDPS